MLEYLEKRFDFSESNILEKFVPLSLEKGTIAFEELVLIVEALQLADINLDDLFEECLLVNTISQSLKDIQNLEEKWVKIFSGLDKSKLKNVFRIVSFVLSIPASNAFAERLFSVMSIKWNDTMSRKTVELVKSELLVYTNINLSCSDFHQQCLDDKKLLDNAKSSLKYNF